MMRITFNSSYREPLADLERAAGQMASYQRQVSSGKRIQRPSDDPAAAAAVVRERAEMATLDRYVEAADSAETRLRAAEAVLADIVSQVTNARVAVQSARGSETTPAQREAAAAELESISSAILSDVGISVNGAFLFSGTASTLPPYSLQGGTVSDYQGNGTSQVVDVDRNLAVAVSFDARRVVAPDGSSVFSVLSGLAAAVRAGDAAGIEAGLEELSPIFDAAVRVQSEVGKSFEALETQRERLGVLGGTSLERLSRLEDADMARAISGLANSETVYRAALGAIGARGRLSLLDYLK